MKINPREFRKRVGSITELAKFTTYSRRELYRGLKGERRGLHGLLSRAFNEGWEIEKLGLELNKWKSENGRDARRGK